VPAVSNDRLKLPPGAIRPESHVVRSFDVAVCAMVSLFIQVTLVPREMASGFAPNALVVRFLAPIGIVAVTAAAPGDGEGVGDEGGDELLPQASVDPINVTTRMRRLTWTALLSPFWQGRQIDCPLKGAFWREIVRPSGSSGLRDL